MIRSSDAIKVASTSESISTINSSPVRCTTSSASVHNAFTNFTSSATIASSSPMKNGANSQRLRNTQDSSVDSTLFIAEVSLSVDASSAGKARAWGQYNAST